MTKDRENEKRASEKVIISLNDAKNDIKRAILLKQMGVKNYQPGARMVRYWFISPPGVGKTSMIGGISNELKCGMRIVTCSNLSQGDLSGFPAQVPPRDKNDRIHFEKFNLMEFFPTMPGEDCSITWEEYEQLNDPNFEPSADLKKRYDAELKGKYSEYFNAGFIFMDELGNLNDPIVRNECLQFCDGTFRNGADWPSLPPAWAVIAAGNTDETSGNELEWQKNILYRFTIKEISARYDENYKAFFSSYKERTWGSKEGYHPIILAYLNEHPGDLCKPEENDENTAPSPRKWGDVSQVLRLNDVILESGFMDTKSARIGLETDIRASLGGEVSTKFLLYLDMSNKMIKADDIINGRLKDKSLIEKDLNIKLYSIYTAIDKVKEMAKIDKKGKFKEKYLNILENAAFLLGEFSIDNLGTIAIALINSQDEITDSKDFSPVLKKATENAMKYMREV